jgi:hypothetical protein
MLHDFSVYLHVFQLERRQPFIMHFSLFLDELFFRVPCDDKEKMHESVEGEEAALIELHLAHFSHSFQIIIESIFLLGIHNCSEMSTSRLLLTKKFSFLIRLL